MYEIYMRTECNMITNIIKNYARNTFMRIFFNKEERRYDFFKLFLFKL